MKRLSQNQSTVLAIYCAIGLTHGPGPDSGISANEIAEALPNLGRSSLYAALAGLEQKGWLISAWDTMAGHPHKVYAMTPAPAEEEL